MGSIGLRNPAIVRDEADPIHNYGDLQAPIHPV